MRFKLIPQLSETLPLPPLLGHTVLMAAVPLLTHTFRRTHCPSHCSIFFFFTLRYKMRFRRCSGEVGVSAVFSVCAAPLCHVIFDTTPFVERTGLNLVRGFKHRCCRASTCLWFLSALVFIPRSSPPLPAASVLHAQRVWVALELRALDISCALGHCWSDWPFWVCPGSLAVYVLFALFKFKHLYI